MKKIGESHMRKVLLSLLPLLLIGCATMSDNPASISIAGNKIVISERFNSSKHKSIAILPFRNSGKEGLDYGIADKFSMHCMDLGFIVIERTQLEHIFKELHLELTGVLSKSDLNRIGKILNLDMIVFGTAGYDWVPGGSFVNAYGGQSIEGRNILVNETVRFVDVSTGEVLISIFANQPEAETKSFSTAMSLLLKDKLNELKTQLPANN